jgi:hypothetical protein
MCKYGRFSGMVGGYVYDQLSYFQQELNKSISLLIIPYLDQSFINKTTGIRIYIMFTTTPRK